MYVNAFICLEENISGYGMNKKPPSGHVTIMTPGVVRCYIQDLDQKGKSLVLYLISKSNNKAVRVGELNPVSKDKETRWKTDINNMFESGVKGNEIDGAAVVIEGDTVGNTDTVLTGFMKDKYMLAPLIEKALPKKVVTPKVVTPKVVTPKVEQQPKVEQPKVDKVKEVVANTAKTAVKEVAQEVVKEVAKAAVKGVTKTPQTPPIVEQIIEKVVEGSAPEVEKSVGVYINPVKLEENIENCIKEYLKNHAPAHLQEDLWEEIEANLSSCIEKAIVVATINGKEDLFSAVRELVENQAKQNNKDKDQVEQAVDTTLNKLIKDQLTKLMQQNGEDSFIEEIGVEEEDKVDFCQACEGCSDAEEDYLNRISSELDRLQGKVEDKKKMAEIVTEEPTRNKEFSRVKEIFTTSEIIYPFAVEDTDRDWVKISHAELVSIPQLSYEWCMNPAIIFSAHKYGHLILGKDKVLGHYYIGIPDNYHPTRKGMLSTDKVERFLCSEEGNVSIGKFGYWMINL